MDYPTVGMPHLADFRGALLHAKQKFSTCYWDELDNSTTKVYCDGKNCVCIIGLGKIVWQEKYTQRPPVQQCMCNVTILRTPTMTYYFPVHEHTGVNLVDANNALSFNFSLWTNLYQRLSGNKQISQLAAATWTKVLTRSLAILHQRTEILKVSTQAQQMTVHHWYDIFRGWSPSWISVLNIMIHPIIVFFVLIGIMLA